MIRHKNKNVSSRRFSRGSGFTLIELLTVVAIIGLLAAVAVPTYARYVVRANQADAKDKLTEVMFQMERYITRNRTYSTDLRNLGYAAATVTSDNNFYTIKSEACAGVGLTRCVLLTATPIAGGRQEGSGVFTLDNRGRRSFNGSIGGWKK